MDRRYFMTGQGPQFATAYNQLNDLDAQQIVFTQAIHNNNKALAKFLYPTLVNAFRSSHAQFLPELKSYLLRLAHEIAPHCQLETMLYLCDLRHDAERVLSLDHDQYISLMIATGDQATFLYFLATSDLSQAQLAPHLNNMTQTKRTAIENLFAEQEDLQEARPRNGILRHH